MILILGNPFSGKGKNSEHMQRLEHALQVANLAYQICWRPDEAKQALALDAPSCFVVAGGDGSVALGFNLLRECNRNDTPLATLPMGNENLFARHFNFSREPEELVQRIVNGQPHTIDLAECNGQLFTLMASAGLDAEVVHRLHSWRQRQNGTLHRVSRITYTRPVLGALTGYAHPTIRLWADDKCVGEGAFALIANIPAYGGQLKPTPLADPSDGKLDWVLLRAMPKWRMAGIALDLFLGRFHERKDVIHGHATQLRMEPIDQDNPAPLQLDGDSASHIPATCNIMPTSAHVLLEGSS